MAEHFRHLLSSLYSFLYTTSQRIHTQAPQVFTFYSKERERGRKEERDKTLDKALLKKVGRWKAHWRILGNSVCLCCITFPVQTLWERTKIKTKRRGNKARICKEKFFTLNEKQIFEQMETFFYVSSLAASRHRSFISIAQNASFGFHPWKTC